jgi:multidrug efflux pump subunit AcrA (membrane-fusion protein)
LIRAVLFLPFQRSYDSWLHRHRLDLRAGIDQASATMRLKAMFANEDEQLWPGDFVNARVSLKALRGALTVPSAAIQTGPDGIFAWVVAEGDVVQARPITSGPATDGRTSIISGLAEATVSSSAANTSFDGTRR